jgi:hypothetical protein
MTEEAAAYGILWLSLALPVGLCLMMAKILGLRMNWLTMAMMPIGFIFLITATVFEKQLLFLPAALLFVGHLVTIRAIQKPTHVWHF